MNAAARATYETKRPPQPAQRSWSGNRLLGVVGATYPRRCVGASRQMYP